MKHILCFAVLFSLLWFKILRADAPPINQIVILAGEPIFPYNIKDPFLRAVIQFESNFNPKAINKHTGARGILQILPVMVNDVNRICRLQGKTERYTWADAFDPLKSIEMWYIKQNYSNPQYYPDKACRIWFGTGIQKHNRMTWEDYYNIVMKKIQ